MRKHLLVSLGFGITIFTVSLLKIGCLFRYLFAIPCPCCGMTRAFWALVELDAGAYLYYHALALPTLFGIWLVAHAKLFKHKRTLFVISVLLLLCNLAYYFSRFKELIISPQF